MVIAKHRYNKNQFFECSSTLLVFKKILVYCECKGIHYCHYYQAISCIWSAHWKYYAKNAFAFWLFCDTQFSLESCFFYSSETGFFFFFFFFFKKKDCFKNLRSRFLIPQVPSVSLQSFKLTLRCRSGLSYLQQFSCCILAYTSN